MPNPFPGVDPYLEDPAFWPDFHSTFIVCWRDALRGVLPPNYEARIGERVYLVEPPASRRVGPDLSVSRSAAGGTVPTLSGSTSTSAVLEPVTVPLGALEEVRESYIEILHRPDRTLVAVLEVLSPANKEEPGRGDYLAKRNAALRQNVHLVELDFLIGGQRLPMGAPLPAGHYYALVSRADRRPNCDVYAWTVRQPLPPIPIPLRAPDPDALTDLAAVFGTAYARGFYDESINYTAPTAAPFSAQDRAWIRDVAEARR